MKQNSALGEMRIFQQMAELRPGLQVPCRGPKFALPREDFMERQKCRALGKISKGKKLPWFTATSNARAGFQTTLGLAGGGKVLLKRSCCHLETQITAQP
jgi:hypothetical protein